MAAHPRVGDGRRTDLSSAFAPSWRAESALFAGTTRARQDRLLEGQLRARDAEPSRPPDLHDAMPELVVHAPLADLELALPLDPVADEVTNGVEHAPAVPRGRRAQRRGPEHADLRAAELVARDHAARLEGRLRTDEVAGEAV